MFAGKTYIQCTSSISSSLEREFAEAKHKQICSFLECFEGFFEKISIIISLKSIFRIENFPAFHIFLFFSGKSFIRHNIWAAEWIFIGALQKHEKKKDKRSDARPTMKRMFYYNFCSLCQKKVLCWSFYTLLMFF